ncbi:MAG TPA: lysine 2,3-aminomutase, partial [Thermoanaerobaculia bacterium]|nr:lysine 2,3-aminomutase [Thermoanaerobaculia bacterium]
MKQGAFASIEPVLHRREAICELLGEPYDPARWNDWRWQMRHRLTRLDQFEKLIDLTEGERRGFLLAHEKFSVAVTPQFAALIDP